MVSMSVYRKHMKQESQPLLHDATYVELQASVMYQSAIEQQNK